jgi:hypothetical protein
LKHELEPNHEGRIIPDPGSKDIRKMSVQEQKQWLINDFQGDLQCPVQHSELTRGQSIDEISQDRSGEADKFIPMNAAFLLLSFFNFEKDYNSDRDQSRATGSAFQFQDHFFAF